MGLLVESRGQGWGSLEPEVPRAAGTAWSTGGEGHVWCHVPSVWPVILTTDVPCADTTLRLCTAGANTCKTRAKHGGQQRPKQAPGRLS